MYHTIVKRILRNGFQAINDHNYDPVIAQCHPKVVHQFAGDHALGGVRHDRDTLHRWFQRLGRVMPTLQLTITDVVVSGLPHHTVATVRWDGYADLGDGLIYQNRGLHVLTLSWGRIMAFDVYLDAQKTGDALRKLGERGQSEAIAPQITS